MDSGLARLIAFLQTSHDDGDPVGRTAEGLAGWLRANGLVEQDLTVTGEHVMLAGHLRAALSALIASGAAGARDSRTAAAIDAAVARAGTRLQLQEDGKLTLTGDGPGVEGALASLVVALYRAQLSGDAERLKACRQCGWAFYDESRNRSRVWCDMALCGSQLKSRAYRQRKAARSGL